MDKVKVLIVSTLDLYPGYVEDITAVDPRVSVKNGIRQMVAELRSKGVTGIKVDRLENEAGLVPDTREDLDSMLAEAEVLFVTGFIPDNVLRRAPGLKWIHLTGAGIDEYAESGIFGSKVLITNSKGTAAIPVAEYILAFMFMLAKSGMRLFANKQDKRWERFLSMELRDKVVGIIGLGHIGEELARLAKGIGMKVIATRRSVVKREAGVLGVDELYPRSDLLGMLSASDFVVNLAPITPATKGMIGAAELRAMKPMAFFINVSRGQVVDEPVLVKALKEGWIAGAALDVFEAEPLPVDSELWNLPNVILSAHQTGATDKRSHRIIELFCENLKRYLAGEELLNVMADREKGY